MKPFLTLTGEKGGHEYPFGEQRYEFKKRMRGHTPVFWLERIENGYMQWWMYELTWREL